DRKPGDCRPQPRFQARGRDRRRRARGGGPDSSAVSDDCRHQGSRGVIATLLAVILGAALGDPRPAVMPAATAGRRVAAAQDPSPQDTSEKKPKKIKKAEKGTKALRDPAKPKKKKSDQLAPDAIADPESESSNGSGIGFRWKAHPSLRFGEKFRVDFEAKLQEDAHGSYPGANGLNCSGAALPTPCTFQLH